jgi:hypothetical protein
MMLRVCRKRLYSCGVMVLLICVAVRRTYRGKQSTRRLGVEEERVSGVLESLLFVNDTTLRSTRL